MIYKEFNINYLDEVSKLYVKSFNSPPWNDKWTEETAKKRLNQMLNCEGAYGLVCYLENEIVAMILGNHEYYYDGIHFNIKEFCVDNTKKGKGIGKKVLNEFTIRLKDKGISNIYLWTAKGDMTEGFYKKNGYDVMENLIVMGKEI